MRDNQFTIAEAENMAAAIFDIGTLIARTPDICSDHPMFSAYLPSPYFSHT